MSAREHRRGLIEPRPAGAFDDDIEALEALQFAKDDSPLPPLTAVFEDDLAALESVRPSRALAAPVRIEAIGRRLTTQRQLKELAKLAETMPRVVTRCLVASTPSDPEESIRELLRTERAAIAALPARALTPAPPEPGPERSALPTLAREAAPDATMPGQAATPDTGSATVAAPPLETRSAASLPAAGHERAPEIDDGAHRRTALAPEIHERALGRAALAQRWPMHRAISFALLCIGLVVITLWLVWDSPTDGTAPHSNPLRSAHQHATP